SSPHPWSVESRDPIPVAGSWPPSGWGDLDGCAYAGDVTAWPVRREYAHLEEFLEFEATPLSLRATQGFLRRTRESTLRFPEGFIDEVVAHLEAMTGAALVA